MTEMALSPLRRRMIEDMTVRNVVEKTQNDYIRHVKNLTAFLGRSPDTATAEELRLYQLQLTEAGVRPPTINSAVSALRFFFSVTVDRPAVTKPLTFVAEPRKIPIVLSLEEVVRVLEAAPGPKYKAALSAASGAGLRVSEVVALKVGDVDSKRMLLRIEQGKGRRDRCAMLSPQLLELLRDTAKLLRAVTGPGPVATWCAQIACARCDRARIATLQRGWCSPQPIPHAPQRCRSLLSTLSQSCGTPVPDAEIAIERPTTELLPAGSFPGGFRNAGLASCGKGRHGRHPKPFTDLVIPERAFGRPLVARSGRMLYGWFAAASRPSA
jgi:site-specific recombinase XerC